MDCLAEQTIAQYVEAGLDVATMSQVEQHIDGCVSCRMAIAEAARGRAAASNLPIGAPATLDGAQHVTVPVPAFLPGAQLGRYVVRRVVGGGAMGLVYAAHDPKLDREIALKLLRPELTGPADRPGLTERLLREAQLMARLTHPNVVAVYDVGVLDGQVFVAMELVIGQTLRRTLSGLKKRSWREVLALFLAAGRGLSAAHRVHVVHRDFKPEKLQSAEKNRPHFPRSSGSLGKPQSTSAGHQKPGRSTC